MDFTFTEEQRLIAETAKRFADNELVGLADRIDRGDRQVLLEQLAKLAEMGFMGINVAAAYGGIAAGVVAFTGAIMALARGCASTAHIVATNNMVAEIIQATGTEAQKQYFIPKLCSGESLAGTFCLSEAQAGSDPTSMITSAKRIDGGWVLNGSKSWISSAEYAGVHIVWAVTDPSAPRGKGISCFVVDGESPGIEIQPGERKLGQRGSCTNPVIFNNCYVADDALLGELNRGYRIAVGELAGGRIGIAALALGIAGAAMDHARAYTAEREQFGQRICDFQGVQWMLSDAYTELEAGALMTYRAADLKQSGRNYGKAAAMAKLFSTEAANRACYQALQLMGGVGYTEELPLERHVRDARITTIYEGTSEIQRVIIARELLREIS